MEYKFVKFLQSLGRQIQTILNLEMSVKERAVAIGDAYWSLMDQAEEVDYYAWIIDLFVDDGGGMFAVIASNGKLYRAEISFETNEAVLSEDWQQVIQEFVPVEQGRGSFQIRELEDGSYRWLSISATAALNRSGEIDSRDLFDSFVDHAESTGEYPIRQFYHQGSAFRTGQTDFLAREGNLLITSGVYDDSELANREVAARQNDPDYWGDSIGFVANGEHVEFAPDIEIPVYTEGEIREISTLPEDQAASWLTNYTDVVKEVVRMKEKQMEAFVKLFDGDEDAAQTWLVENAEDANRTIAEAGMLTRETTEEEAAEVSEVEEIESEVETEEEETEEEETTEESTEEESPEEDETEIAVDESIIQEIAREFLESETVMNLTAEVARLVGVVESLEDKLSVFEGEQIARNVSVSNRLDAMEKTEEAKQKEYINDLPRKTLRTKAIFKPREVRSEEGNGEVEQQAIADATLSVFPD